MTATHGNIRESLIEGRDGELSRGGRGKLCIPDTPGERGEVI